MLSYKLHGSARPISMKSDVIRKRSRHDARRAGGPIEQTPSTSPGHSRRASPVNDNVATPTFAPDSTTQGYEYDYSHASQSELMNALAGHPAGYSGSYSLSSYTSGVYPGPWNPELLKEAAPAPADTLPFSGVEPVDGGEDGPDGRASKRRRMSNVSSVSSGTEPPLSAASYGSYDSGFGSGSSSLAGAGASAHPQFPYASYSSYNLMRASSAATQAFWPVSTRSPASFVHPPMLPPDESGMDYGGMGLAGAQHHGHDDTDYALFSTYLHPPMLPPDSPQHTFAGLHQQHQQHQQHPHQHQHQHQQMQHQQHQHQLHPPMLPPDTIMGDIFNESGIASY
jgi:GATA-binding protein